VTSESAPWFATPRGMSTEAERLTALTEQIIGAAIEVHRVLGPGLLESAYESCVCYELINVKILTQGGVMRKVNGFPE